MKWLAYRIPRKGKSDIFYVPYQPFTFLEAMGRAYLHEARKDKFEILLLTPKIEDENIEFLKTQIQGGILDSIYRDEKFISEVLRRINIWMIGRVFGSWWIRYVIPAASIGWAINYGFTGGLAFDVLLGLYLFKGRDFFVRKIQKEVASYYEKTKRGIERSYKNLAGVKQIKHKGLKKLQEIIEKSKDKTAAYIKAMHACDELGLPELKEFFANSAPIEEQTIQEPHLGFPIKDKQKESFKREFSKLQKGKVMKDQKINLFDYDVDANWLYHLKTFSDLDEEIEKIASRIGATEVLLFTTPRGCKIKAYEIGNKKASEKILILGGCHGREPAGPLAVLQMMKSFKKEGKYTRAVLENSQIIFIPCTDPEGFTMRAWMAVDMEGHEEHWPPQRRIVRYRDTNGVWGDRVQSPRIMAIQDYIKSEIKKPTLAFDLHETVGKYADLTFKGAGILSIESFHIPERIYRRLESIPVKPTNFISRALCKIPANIRRWIPLIDKEWRYSILKEIPAFEIGEAALQNVKKKGLKTYRGGYQALLEKRHPYNPPQLLAFAEGRTVDGPLLYELDIRVCTTWLYEEFGTIAITTETFQNSSDERVLEQVAFVEGAILKKLKIR